MNLDVLIPSLLLPAPVHTLFPPLAVPALERLLARADTQVALTPAGSNWLCERWGVAAPHAVAPLLAEYDGLETLNEGWMFAEPVHLIPDRARLKLFPAGFLKLSAAESAELISALNSHFADRHLQFFAPVPDALPQRWYVRCSPSEIPATTPPGAAHIGSLADFQPTSTGTMDWRSLQNEAQMLFFGHPVNEAREANGQPAVSGVWFWGGGVVPGVQKPAYGLVAASLALAVALAKKSAIDVRAPAWESIQSAHGNVLAVIDSCAVLAGNADFSAWAHEVERLEREWFVPLSKALASGAIKRLSLHVPDAGGTRTFHLTRRDQLLRFWRAAKPLAHHA